MKNFLLSSFLMLCTLFAQAQGGGLADGEEPECAEEGQVLMKGFIIEIGTSHIGSNEFLGTPGFFDVRTGRPSTFNVYYMFRIPLIKRYLTLCPGMGFGLDNYYFRNPVTVSPFPVNGEVFGLAPADMAIIRAKLNPNYFDVPLELHFRTSRNYKKSFRAAIGGKAGILFDSKSKLVYRAEGSRVVEKASDISVRRFRYGLTGRLGYGVFNVFAYYSLSPLFQSEFAPDITPITFGVSIASF